MKKLVLIVLLLLVASRAYADYVTFSDSSEGSTVTFSDNSSSETYTTSV